MDTSLSPQSRRAPNTMTPGGTLTMWGRGHAPSISVVIALSRTFLLNFLFTVLLVPAGFGPITNNNKSSPSFVLASNVFAKMKPLGDRGFHGDFGPPGRSGHVAVVNDESRMFVFGGKVRVPNGDYLNDLWLYDWNTGNWTAYNPNELVCEVGFPLSAVLSAADNAPILGSMLLPLSHLRSHAPIPIALAASAGAFPRNHV